VGASTAWGGFDPVRECCANSAHGSTVSGASASRSGGRSR
jgi:hypothetical protein